MIDRGPAGEAAGPSPVRAPPAFEAVCRAGRGPRHLTPLLELLSRARRPLVLDIIDDETDDPMVLRGRQALVAAMVRFAASTGCRIVATGVETRDEAETLKGLGVDFARGPWFGDFAPARTWRLARRSRSRDAEGAPAGRAG